MDNQKAQSTRSELPHFSRYAAERIEMKHPHAELMAQYAQDAMETDKPWERWEFNPNTGIWIANNYHPAWEEKYEYRRLPKRYTPTLLDQALELEIEAAKLRLQNIHGRTLISDVARLNERLCDLVRQRSPAMIEHLKHQGKL